MNKQINNVNAKTDYLDKYREIRKFASFNFEKDLRSTKNDNQFTTAEKSSITRIWNNYLLYREFLQNGSAKVIPIRHKKNESKTQYKKRVKQLQKKISPDLKFGNFIVAKGGKGAKYSLKNGELMITKKNQVLESYPINFVDDEKIHFVYNPFEVVKHKVEKFIKEHTNRQVELVGLMTGGYEWKTKGVQSVEKLIEYYENEREKYLAQGGADIAEYITGIVIKA
jgi:hypothetical protein